MTKKPSPGPILFDVPEDAEPAVTPASAPPVPDTHAPQASPAMQRLANIAAKKPSRLSRWFWSSIAALLGFVVSMAAWDFVMGLIARNQILGGIALALLGVFVSILLLIAAKELLALSRLARVEGIRARTEQALAGADLKLAKHLCQEVASLYAKRPELQDARKQIARRVDEVFDADAALEMAEQKLLSPLDAQARLQVEAAARQVATVTAIVPLALADVVTALTANLRMIRQIAEIYGGRSGTLGSWRLTRAVLAHLVATGAVAVGDDLIGSIAGGGVLSKLSRRFGEGLINGALTARVGVAAIEVCRPMPFLKETRPNVSKLVTKALAGIIPGVSGS